VADGLAVELGPQTEHVIDVGVEVEAGLQAELGVMVGALERHELLVVRGGSQRKGDRYQGKRQSS
jgi:hypothetical protein